MCFQPRDVMANLTRYLAQRRQDVAHEPVCQQALQQSVQGHYWCGLVSGRALGRLTRSVWLTTDVRHSLTKEVMVDDRLVTMQVRAQSPSPLIPLYALQLLTTPYLAFSCGTRPVRSVSSRSVSPSTVAQTAACSSTT